MVKQDKEIILLKVSGQDKPGVTAGLTSILATYDATMEVNPAVTPGLS